MITLHDVTLSRGSKVLLQNVNVSLHERQKIGLIGLNGCGKSSLFSLLLNELQTDTGTVSLNNNLRISHLSQNLPDSDYQALDFVLSGDKNYFAIQQKLAEAEKNGDDAEIIACHNELANTDGYSKPALAAAIMAGLGFTTAEQKQELNSFSGGWRMRLSLARCLMSPADLLLLDEPTNHLDMEAIFWLERWLKNFPGSIILISHDREFLDTFVTHILHIENKNIKLYTGNYSRFENARAEYLTLQQATYAKQQAKIAHLMNFVNRFKAKASKAKQAQSRLKTIAKMELVAQAQMDSPFTFEFLPSPKAGKPLINCEKVSVAYTDNNFILKNINFILNPEDRIGLLGPNGEGKSTFIKTLLGDLKPREGQITHNKNINIGYFAQHQLEQLDLNLSPIATLQELTPKISEQVIRNYLGGFNFIGDMATNSIRYFSGGEKARLVLAKIVWLKPNLLLLDEPTNHLDLEMRAALEIALQSYEGALIIISHDRHMLRSVVDDYYLVFNKKVSQYPGNIDDYHEWLLTKDKIVNTEPTKKEFKNNKNNQNKLKKLEDSLERYNNDLKKVEDELADANLYLPENSELLALKLAESKKLREKIQQIEEEWMTVVNSAQ